jgi:hypothetical protein
MQSVEVIWKIGWKLRVSQEVGQRSEQKKAVSSMSVSAGLLQKGHTGSASTVSILTRMPTSCLVTYACSGAVR